MRKTDSFSHNHSLILIGVLVALILSPIPFDGGDSGSGATSSPTFEKKSGPMGTFFSLGNLFAGEVESSRPVPLQTRLAEGTTTERTAESPTAEKEASPPESPSLPVVPSTTLSTIPSTGSDAVSESTGNESATTPRPVLVPRERSTETPDSPSTGPNPSSESAEIEELSITRKTVYSRGLVLFEFSNGLTLFVQPTPSDFATVRAYVRNTGSLFEGEKLGSGISHLTEHIVYSGSTTRRTEEETKRVLDSLGGGGNASTSSGLTSYFIDCPSESIPTAMELLADWTQNCVIDEEEFRREKGVVLQEITDSRSDPNRVAEELLLKTVYRQSPYRHPIGGYPDLFRKLTREDVQRFYRTRYVPNNLVFLVVGRIDPVDAAETLMRFFRGSERGPEMEAILPAEPAQISPREAVQELDSGRFRLLLAWPTVTLDDPDLYPLDVLALLLAGGESGRLNRKLKNEKPLGFSFDASSRTPEVVPGFFLIQAETSPENLEAVQTEILDELRRMTETPVTEEELDRAKKQCEASFVFGQERPADAADFAVRNYLATGDPDFDQQYLTGVRNVSAEEITRVLNRYFRPEKQSRVLIAPIGMTPESLVESASATDSDVEAFRIPENQIRILLKRSATVPMVEIQVYFLGSALLENDESAGRTALLAATLDKGSERYSRTEIENYFDSIGGQLSFQAGRNTLGVRMTVLKEDYKNALSILADLLLHPTFPEDEFQKAKAQQLAAIDHRSDNPLSELFEFFSASLPSTTPFHLPIEGTPESVGKMTSDDLREAWRQIVVPERMIVTLFGDIDSQDAAYEVKNLFGSMPKSDKLPEITFDRANNLPRDVDAHKTTRKETGTGLIAWPAVSIRAEKDHAALTVLQTILGGYGSPGGRLFEETRGAGLVYQLSVGQMTGPAPGYFYVVFVTRPDKIGEVFDRIEKGIERIKDGDLTNEEVERAKTRIITFHPKTLETLADSARQMALNDLYGLGYKYDLQFNDRINNITRDDVIDVAEKYFRQRIRVSTSPNEKR